MENFTNYSMMLGITDMMSADEIESEISRYKKRYFELNGGFQELKYSIEFLDSNINGLKRMLKKRKDAELSANFILKIEHILLLRSMDFKSFENGGDYVFLGVGFVRLPPLLFLHINFLWCKSISPGYGSQYGYLLKCLYIIAFFTSAKSANVSYICFSFRSISFTL